MTTEKNQTVKLNKVKFELSPNQLKNLETVKVDKRKNNPGRPVNKQSARYKRLAKQAFYSKVNKLFVSGKSFKLKENQPSEYHYSKNSNDNGGCLFNGVGHYVCNIDYIGRTKVTGFTYVLNKRVNVELNLKTLNFTA